jgi:hypothetical protein
MGGHDLEILESSAPVRSFVFDANVGKMDVAVDERKIVFTRPLGDLALPLLPFPLLLVIAATLSIQVTKEALVIPLQLVVEHDTLYFSATIAKAITRVNVCAVQFGVMCQFSRLDDASIEGLLGLVSVPFSMRFEEVSSTFGQRHQRCFATFNDMGNRADEAQLS